MFFVLVLLFCDPAHKHTATLQHESPGPGGCPPAKAAYVLEKASQNCMWGVALIWLCVSCKVQD